jgi:hypothetical protein
LLFLGVASGPFFFANGPQVSVHEFATISMNGFHGESHPVFWPRFFLKRYTDLCLGCASFACIYLYLYIILYVYILYAYLFLYVCRFCKVHPTFDG